MLIVYHSRLAASLEFRRRGVRRKVTVQGSRQEDGDPFETTTQGVGVVINGKVYSGESGCWAEAKCDFVRVFPSGNPDALVQSADGFVSQ